MPYETPQEETSQGNQEELEVSRFLDRLNIAESIDAAKLASIGQRVVDDYDIDKASRSDWEEMNRQAMELAKLIGKKKTFPFKGASNVYYPLITSAAIQFHARAYPNIMQTSGVVKGKVTGYDPDGAKASRACRIGEFMSWQLTEQMEEWEEELDKALLVLPITGCFFRKTYYSTLLGRNVSRLVYAEDLVVNNSASSLTTATRTSELIEYRPNEYIEQVRAGTFLNVELGESSGRDEDDRRNQSEQSHDDEDLPHIFIEQHRWIDLDGDGYQEPYIVTVHKDTAKVVRISTRFQQSGIITGEDGQLIRIEPDLYYTKFGFLPDPTGGFYDWGFGRLLAPINRTVNTTINQLLDAGTMSNAGGGFIGRGVKVGGKGRGRTGKTLSFGVNEWKSVDFTGDDLSKNIMPLPVKEPSPTLFSLLGMMVDAGKELSSIADVMSGQSPGMNVPAATTLALIEQGMKVFTAIYKRIYRSLKKEFKKLYRLNAIYLPQAEYSEVMDDQKAVTASDFSADFDVIPVGDPNEVSDMQKIFKSQALMQFQGQGLNDQVIQRRALEALAIPDIEEITENVPKPPPPPEVVVKAQEFELKGREMAVKEEETRQAAEKLPFEIEKLRTEAIKNIADAESKEPGQQLAQYNDIITALAQQVQTLTDAIGQLQGAQPVNGDYQGAVPGMEATPGDVGGMGEPGVIPGVPEGEFGAGTDIEPVITGPDIA